MSISLSKPASRRAFRSVPNGAAALAHFAQRRFALMGVAHPQFAATPGAILFRAIEQQTV